MKNVLPDLLDSLLGDYLPPKYRRMMHFAILLVLAIVSIIMIIAATAKSNGGDWLGAVMSVLGMLYAASNAANTKATTLSQPVVDEVQDQTYEDLGGQPYEVSGNGSEAGDNSPGTL